LHSRERPETIRFLRAFRDDPLIWMIAGGLIGAGVALLNDWPLSGGILATLLCVGLGLTAYCLVRDQAPYEVDGFTSAHTTMVRAHLRDQYRNKSALEWTEHPSELSFWKRGVSDLWINVMLIGCVLVSLNGGDASLILIVLLIAFNRKQKVRVLTTPVTGGAKFSIIVKPGMRPGRRFAHQLRDELSQLRPEAR
jgi:hypothetical protein